MNLVHTLTFIMSILVEFQQQEVEYGQNLNKFFVYSLVSTSSVQ